MHTCEIKKPDRSLANIGVPTGVSLSYDNILTWLMLQYYDTACIYRNIGIEKLLMGNKASTKFEFVPVISIDANTAFMVKDIS